MSVTFLGAPCDAAFSFLRDVAEFNPWRDLDGVTAVVAAKLVKELAGVLAR